MAVKKTIIIDAQTDSAEKSIDNLKKSTDNLNESTEDLTGSLDNLTVKKQLVDLRILGWRLLPQV
jgi:prefoldin subunit 5